MKELTKKEIQRLIEYWFTLLEIQDMDKAEDRELYRKLVNMQGEMSDGTE
jgi:hypothetical protein